MEDKLRERLKRYLSQTLVILSDFPDLKEYVNDSFSEKLLGLNLPKVSLDELLDSRERGLLALRDFEERKIKTPEVIRDEILGKLIIAEIETELNRRNAIFMGGAGRRSSRLLSKKRVNYSPRKRRRIGGGVWDKIKSYFSS